MLGIFRAVTAPLVELQLRPSLPTDVVVVRVNDLVEGLQLAIDRFLAEVETDPQRAGGQDLTPAQFERQQRRPQQVRLRIGRRHSPLEARAAGAAGPEAVAIGRKRVRAAVQLATAAGAPGRSRGAPSRRPSPRLLSRRPKGLQPERLELGGRQRDPRDGVNPAPRESLPRPFDLRNRDTGLPQEISERVEPLAPGLAASKRAVQWCEGDPVHRVDRIDIPTDPRDMQEPRNRASH